MSNKQLTETSQINVTISRLPGSIITKLETELGLFYDENDLDPAHEHTLQALIVGYGAAWDEIERLLEENKRLTTENAHAFRTIRVWQEAHNDMESELQQTREELREANNELEGWCKGELKHYNSRMEDELEQVKAERGEALRGSTCDACRGVILENDKLRDQLSAKDKVQTTTKFKRENNQCETCGKQTDGYYSDCTECIANSC